MHTSDGSMSSWYGSSIGSPAPYRFMWALETFQSLGIEFVSLTEDVDTSTAAGKMVFTVLGAVAELERSLTAERVKVGLRNAPPRGKNSDGEWGAYIGWLLSIPEFRKGFWEHGRQVSSPALVRFLRCSCLYRLL